MTDILITWLNNNVQLSKKIDSISFAADFANGYLIGEVLHKYQLQDDFDQFSQSKASESKLNNFTRIEPILNLLGIPFDTNTARAVMTEKHGEATKLMYQLFIALNKKQKTGLTGTAMETMRPAAPAKLDYMKSLIYKERLKHLTPRQADLNLEALQSEFQQKAVKMEKTAFRLQLEEEERINAEVQRRRLDLMEKRRQAQQQMAEKIAKIHAANVEIAVPPARTLKLLNELKAAKKQHEIDGTLEDIMKFEAKLAAVLSPSKPFDKADIKDILDEENDGNAVNELDYLQLKDNSAYINKIRKRLNEDEAARNEREKRRRKVMVEQQKAHAMQEETRREEMLVNRLMRQSQQERRIAVQLLQTRHEKDVIKNNRLYREQQYEQQRLKEFDDALNREAELARLAKLDYIEQTKREMEQHTRLVAERAEARYRRHYDMCQQVLGEMVDVACKVAEYRELTEKMIPQKLWNEWTTLFVSGKPLYDKTPPSAQQTVVGTTPAEILESERQSLLNEGDFQEYKEMIGEWMPPEGSEITGPPPSNPIVGHVIHRLFNMVYPKSPPPPPPEFPPFPIKACILGKSFSGKSTAAQKLAEHHRLKILDVDALVEEAIAAYNSNELEPSSVLESGPISMLAVEDAPVVMDTLTTSQIKKTASKKGSKEQPEAQLSARAKLGGKALRLLKKGKPVEDQLCVDVLAQAIRELPEGSGWVLDGFPTTYTQAKLLEKALSGFDASLREPKAKEKSIGKTKTSRLAPDPRPPPTPMEPTSAINVVILFDVPDELCLKRAIGRYTMQQSQLCFHQEFKPPPEGSVTGIQNQEKIIPVQDPAHDQEQVQNRIAGFLDNWPKLEKWYSKFGVLKRVDGTLEGTSAYLEAENILEDTLDRVMKRGKYEPQPETEPVKEAPPPAQPLRDPTPPPAPAVVEIPPEDVRPSSRSSKKGSRAGSAKGRKDGSQTKSSSKKRGESESPGRQGSGKKSEGKSARGTSGKKGKKEKTPEPEPEPEVPTEPPKTPPPAPGSEQYEYVDQPIEPVLAEVLAPHWEAIENTYIDISKHNFNNLRHERERIIRYFYNIRKDFLKYLRRLDTKQEFVDQWVADYNTVPDDMREDEETMAELHQKVDDLRDRLWNICDERKAKAEQERQDIMNDGWLDDRLGILSNHYITQMQAEVDRFQDTVALLKDYYKGMEGHIPDEPKSEFARLPLVELPPTDKPGSPVKSIPDTPVPDQKLNSPAPPDEGRLTPKGQRSPRSTTPTTGKKGKRGRSAKKEEEQPAPASPPREQTEPGKRIPLIPRRRGMGQELEQLQPLTPGKADAKKDKTAKPAKKSQGNLPVEEKTESPTLLAARDPDERIMIESFENGLRALAEIVAQEEVLRKALEEAEMEAAMAAAVAAEKEKVIKADKKGGGKKAGKSRSPTPKKGAKKEKTSAPTTAVVEPTPAPTEETEEEKRMKILRTKAREEFFAAIKIEESACRVRLELIKLISIKALNFLKNKADNVYKDMNDWLGARFLKEIESIDHMSEKMRHAIESMDKIKNQVILEQEDFLVAEDIRMFRTPTPPPRPPPTEQPSPEYFTVNQLKSLYTQFSLVSKDGVLSVKSFIDTFQEFTTLTHGMEMLPDGWMNISLTQLQDLASQLSFDTEYVNWRFFMVSISHPIAMPSLDQLMETLSKFKEMDQRNVGYVTRNQYDNMDLWFHIERMQTPQDRKEPYPYNRMQNLKNILFDFFGDHRTEPSKIYYVDMLMYFSVDPDPFEGFLKALSVVSRVRISQDEPWDSIDIYLENLHQVLHHGEGQGQKGDSHRFSLPSEQDKSLSLEKLQAVYNEIVGDTYSPISFKTLMDHPIVQECIRAFTRFKQTDFKGIFNQSTPGDVNGEVLSIKE